MRVALRIVGVLGLAAVLLGGAGCDQSSSNAGVPSQAASTEPPAPDPSPPEPEPPDPAPEPDPDPKPDPTPDPQPMPEAGQPDAFEQKLDEVRRLSDAGQTRSALILARMMQQQFADHPGLNELIALERRLNEQRDLEAKLAVPLRNLGSDDPATVRVARQMLRRAGTPALPLLRKLARQDQAPGSHEAMLLLAELGDPAALPMLLDEMGGGEDEVLASALHQLAATAGPDIIPTLYRAFAQSPNHTLLDALAATLSAHAKGDAQTFNRLADDPRAYQSVRRYAIQEIKDDLNSEWAARHAAVFSILKPGLRARFYAGTNLEGKPIADLRVDQPYIRRDQLPIKRDENISARWTGKIRIDQAGAYTFMPTSDDGQRVVINGQMIVDDWVYHGPEERKGEVLLEPGLHDFEAQWMQGGGTFEFTLRWQGPGIDRQQIPADRYRVVTWEGME